MIDHHAKLTHSLNMSETTKFRQQTPILHDHPLKSCTNSPTSTAPPGIYNQQKPNHYGPY